ncbi:hypothetical protein DPMN_110303 [Dreissena polymorpha]|uniref:Uncharacterized protein n=1 Tax=Dreissena polymorpha TaxID=45954 RepID=A0A9D4QNR7_DREPO|nr:hypothetical protein DPMN_110303 [Dreissena polymorpha]
MSTVRVRWMAEIALDVVLVSEVSENFGLTCHVMLFKKQTAYVVDENFKTVRCCLRKAYYPPHLPYPREKELFNLCKRFEFFN